MNCLVKDPELKLPKVIESNTVYGVVSTEHLCRICLESVDVLHLLTETSDSSITDFEKLNICFPSINIMENDSYPKSICRKCSQSLDNAYKFHMLAIKSTKILYEMIYGSGIKIQSAGMSEPVTNFEEPEIEDKSIGEHEQLNSAVGNRTEPLHNNKKRKYIRKRTLPARNLKCEICEKKFMDSSHFSRHMRMHTGERPFICEVCGRCFKLIETLGSHRRTHDINRIKKHHCPKCSFQTDKLNNFKVHTRLHTGERPYSCGQCSKTFIEKKPLDVHIIRNHSKQEGISIVTCKFCPVKCRTKHELKAHVNQHSKSILYKCPECSKTYSAHDNLVKHIKKVHQLNKWPNKAATRIINPNYIQLD